MGARPRKHPAKLVQAIRLRSLPQSERARVLGMLQCWDWSKLKKRHPDVVDVGVGTRSRQGRLRTRAEAAIKLFVARKVRRAARPLPKRLNFRMWVQSSVVDPLDGACDGHWHDVSVPTDVVEWCEGHGTIGLPIRATPLTKTKGVCGCLAARLGRVGSHERYWLSAAHVLTRYGQTGRVTTPAKIRARPGGAILGRTDTGSCWRKRGSARVDAGLVEEEHAAHVDPGAIANLLVRWLTLTEIIGHAGTSEARKYRIVRQDDSVEQVVFDTILASGRRLSFPGKPSVTYPRLLRFEGTVRGGDSGTCIFKITDQGFALGGLVVGRLDDGGIVAIPPEDALRAVELGLGHELELRPAGSETS